MENKDRVSAFFAANKQEIQDNGFSKRVINNLPETADKQWIVLLMAAIGTSVTFLVCYFGGIFNVVYSLLKEVPSFAILGVVVAIPLLSLFVVFTPKYGIAKNGWY